MKIAIIDDHAIVRSSLAIALKGALESVELITEANSCETLVNSDPDTKYDLILLDYHIPNKTVENNFAIIQQSFPLSPILFISSDENPQIILDTIKLGASGFVVKSSDMKLLIAAIKFVFAGGKYIPVNIISDIQVNTGTSEHLITSTHNNLSSLSKRQRDVFDLLLQKMPNKVIAGQLNIAESTVKTHVMDIFKVLNIKSRDQVLEKFSHKLKS